MIGTPFLGLNAYKARMGGDSPWCGIEQIHEGGSGPCPIPKADNTWLGKDSFLPQILYLGKLTTFLNLFWDIY